jgi:hypothetical protein
VLAFEEEREGSYVIDFVDIYGPRSLPAQQLASTHHPSEGNSRDGARPLSTQQLHLGSWGK